jgi:hypothetical protein
LSTLTIDGNIIDLDENNVIIKTLKPYVKGSYPVLFFERRGLSTGCVDIGAINRDVWNGKTISLTMDLGEPEETLVFSGQVTSVEQPWTSLGYILSYQALGKRYFGDLVPWTNEENSEDTTYFNLPATDPNFNEDFAGFSIGEMLQTGLQFPTNVANLAQYGIFYSDNTNSDLAAYTIIPPQGVQLGGEKLLGAVESFMTQWMPNATLWVAPTGELRFLNLLEFSPFTLTLGQDLVQPPDLTRDVTDCFQAVEIRGAPWVIPVLLSTSNGGIVEDFTWGSFTTNEEAIANWTAADFQQPGSPSTLASVAGTCTVLDTMTVEVSAPGNTWVENYWSQGTGSMGVIYLNDTDIMDINQFVSRRIVSNTPLTLGGTSILTLDIALTSTSYTFYDIYAIGAGPTVVWRKYAITNQFYAEHLATAFSYPVPYVLASGDASTMTSIPIGSVVGQLGGEEATNFFTVDVVEGTILFNSPNSLIWGSPPTGQVPVDVRALLAINTLDNSVRVPTSGFSGTSNTVEGLENTLVVTVPQWTDPLSLDQMTDYAQDLLFSVQDTVVSGTVTFQGLLPNVLMMGQGLNLAANYGTPITTGFEDAALPILAVEVHFLQGDGSIFETVMNVSNRKAHYTADAFLKTQRPMVLPMIGEGLSSPFGVNLGTSLWDAGASGVGPQASMAANQILSPSIGVSPQQLQQQEISGQSTGDYSAGLNPAQAQLAQQNQQVQQAQQAQQAQEQQQEQAQQAQEQQQQVAQIQQAQQAQNPVQAPDPGGFDSLAAGNSGFSPLGGE